jgi:glycosyltransferase involved in cell wall biosynthesis
MRIAATGFVGENVGSVATSNLRLLKRLLVLGHDIDFFSKPSFVDPGKSLKEQQNFKFYAVDNVFADRLRRKVSGFPGISFAAERWDCSSYNRLLLSKISHEHQKKKYDVCVWFGTYAPGRIKSLPMISFAQGPPGTDAISIIDRFNEIQTLAGNGIALRWLALAGLRLSQIGLPKFKCSDHIIVGCEWSRTVLENRFGVSRKITSCLPYPVDLERFSPRPAKSELRESKFRVLWLGRIVPRKRIDVFLKGMEIAISKGLSAECTIVGDVGFIPGYGKLIESFAYPECIRWIRNIPHHSVAETLNRHDVLAQPSDNENFGSSVAEAQACGVPVIVGRSNGNREYLCERDIALDDDKPESFATALTQMYQQKLKSSESEFERSRKFAVSRFGVEGIAEKLLCEFEAVCQVGK